jgi:hypothetical protein
MSIIIILQAMLACKTRTVEQKSSTPIVTDPEEEIDELRLWNTNELNDEFGFSLFSFNENIYATAPNSTLGKLYQVTSEGLTLKYEGFGRIGHDAIIYNDSIILHSPLLNRLVHLDNSDFANGTFTELISDELHWYALEGNTLLIDGTVTQNFDDTAYDIAVCQGVVGISFPFADKIWVDGIWHTINSNTSFIGPNLFCHDIDNDNNPEWFLGGTNVVFYLQNGEINSIESPHNSFGFSIDFGDIDGDQIPEIWISAPDGGVSSQGWVGLYQSLSAPPIEEWFGQQSNDRFGYSILSKDDSLYVGAPNGENTYVQLITPD